MPPVLRSALALSPLGASRPRIAPRASALSGSGMASPANTSRSTGMAHRNLGLCKDVRVRDTLLERVLRRDRLVVLSGLVGAAMLSWICTWYLAWDMQHSHVALCCMSQLLMFAMWTAMMVGMMLPSAAPMVLLFALVSRKRHEQQRPFVSTGIFLFGYLAIWSLFSALATVL